MVPLFLVAYIKIHVAPRILLLNRDVADRALKCVQNVQYYPLIMVVFSLPNYIVVLSEKAASSLSEDRRFFQMSSVLYTLCWCVNRSCAPHSHVPRCDYCVSFLDRVWLH